MLLFNKLFIFNNNFYKPSISIASSNYSINPSDIKILQGLISI